MVVDKKNSETMIIDIAVHGDFRVNEKEQQKIETYQGLVIKIHRMWQTRAKVVPMSLVPFLLSGLTG